MCDDKLIRFTVDSKNQLGYFWDLSEYFMYKAEIGIDILHSEKLANIFYDMYFRYRIHVDDICLLRECYNSLLKVTVEGHEGLKVFKSVLEQVESKVEVLKIDVCIANRMEVKE